MQQKLSRTLGQNAHVNSIRKKINLSCQLVEFQFFCFCQTKPAAFDSLKAVQVFQKAFHLTARFWQCSLKQ